MTYRVRPFSIIGCCLAAVLILSSAENASARRFDLEVGAGAYISVSSAKELREDGSVSNGAPMEDGWYASLAGAVELSERFDLELALGVGQDHDPVSNNVRTFLSSGLGFRGYLNGTAKDAARVFLSAGGTNLYNYRRGGGSAGAVYLGPGVRLLAGESSGFLVKAPFVIRPDHTEQTLFVPTVSWFYQF